MRYVLTLLLVSGFLSLTQAEEPAIDELTPKLLGAMPRPGNVADVLECAAANERLWLTLAKADPSDIEGDNARQKSSWYTAVALWIFAVESEEVFAAVAAANQRPQEEVFALARTCRRSPNSWRN